MKTKSINFLAASLTVFVVTAIAQPAPFAGNGTRGYSGDGGAATSAQLNDVHAISGDVSGNIYILDGGNSDVRKVNPANIISTVAGNQVAGFTGDGGIATAASLSCYGGEIGLDGLGNLYINDIYNARIRKVSTTGVITTLAGNGSIGYTGDGGAATAAAITASSMAVDKLGNVYLADAGRNIIRKINAIGVINTIAGTGIAGYSGDGGLAINAQFSWPSYLAIDTAGNLFVSDVYNYAIRKINTAGVISTYAGNGTAGSSGDGGSAVSAKIMPGALAFNPNNELYFSTTSPSTYLTSLRKVDNAGIITTAKGSSYFIDLFNGFGGGIAPFYIDNTNAMYFVIWGGCGVARDPGTIYKMSLGELEKPKPIENPKLVEQINLITPNDDGKDDQTLISGEMIEVFNRNGILVRTINGSGIWDGKDNMGTIVPMGYYVAICKETQKTTNITVVR